MKKMKVLRGLPGSGKSTKTVHLLQSHEGTAAVCSADLYFIRPDGQYDWNVRFLKSAHFWCYKKAKEACESGIELVIIDNTNIKKEDKQPYIDLALANGYEVEEIIVGKFDEESCKVYAERNVHGCPLETILRRAKDFQP